MKKRLSGTFAGALLLSIFAAVMPSSASAQWAVFDAPNFTQTLITAGQSVMQVAKETDQYIVQLQQYQTMVQNLKNLPASVMNQAMGQIPGNIRDLIVYRQKLANLQFGLSDAKTIFNGRLSEIAASGLTNDQYMDREYKLLAEDKSRKSILYDNEQQSLQRVQGYYQSALNMRDQIPQNEGMLQATQTMNVQMNQLLMQTADLQASTAERNKETLQKEGDALAEKEALRRTQMMRDAERDAIGSSAQGMGSAAEKWKIFK